MIVILATANAGAWIAGGFALAAGIVAGLVQFRSVQEQQHTAKDANVIRGYDKLVQDLQTEVTTAREETRQARSEAAAARKEARDTRLLFERAEREKHILTIQILHLEQGLADLKLTVERYHTTFGPRPPYRRAADNPPLWNDSEGEINPQ